MDLSLLQVQLLSHSLGWYLLSLTLDRLSPGRTTIIRTHSLLAGNLQSHGVKQIFKETMAAQCDVGGSGLLYF